MNRRAITATILSLGLMVAPATAAHAVRAPAPGEPAMGANDLAPRTAPGHDSVDEATRVRAAMERVLALANGTIDLTTRYRTPYDVSNRAARNRSAIADLRITSS